MKFLLTLLSLTLFFVGCSADKAPKDVEAKLYKKADLSDLKLPDQHGKPHGIGNDTRYLIFSFSKDVGHKCNEFLQGHEADYLPKHHALYIADISAAPSLIKSMFIMKDLKKLPFTILIIDDDTLSAEFTKGVDTSKIVVVTLKDKKIEDISELSSAKELQTLIGQ